MHNMHNKGFTLTEIMITVVIIGILAAVAVPAYTAYMSRVRRSEAVTDLETLALYEEKYISNNPGIGYLTVPNLVTANLGYSDPSGNAGSNYKVVAIPGGANNSTFVAYATPINLQAGDTYDGAILVFGIDSTGNRGTYNAGTGSVVSNPTLWNNLK